MSDDQNNNNASITAEHVAQYLATNPNFFQDHEKLLVDLELPHQSGTAVSLVERQVSVLRERNMDMRHRLSNLLDNARDNDRLFDKTKRLMLELLESQDLKQVIDAFFHSFNNEFNIHYTRLLLIGNPGVLPTSTQAQVISLDDAQKHIPALLKTNRAFCGALGPKETRFIFGEDASQIGSAATVPLLHGTTFGLLAIGNRDPEYYRSSMGTLFLGYIAEGLNRLIPKYLPR